MTKIKVMLTPKVSVLFDMNNTNADFRRELVKFRKDQGLSQMDLGERMGVPANKISTWETGKHSPTLTTLDRIAKGLGAKVGLYFVKDEDENDE